MGLPLVTSMKLVDLGSSESEFGASVNSTMVWASEESPSSSWISSYVLLTNDIISICNTIVEISEVLEYSFPSLKSYHSTKLQSRKQPFIFYLLGSHLWSKSKHNKFHKITRLAILSIKEWFHSNPKFEFKSRQTT